MCGIAGIIGDKANAVSLNSMLHAQKHRGPDYTGAWIESQSIALGHNRLSIIDLTESANQPFHSECGNFVLIFNGEIYNYLEIRSELRAFHTFKTNSDTEVLLIAYQKWGRNCLNKFNGMFSFAIWDKKEQTLFVARDRFGVKPLHYSWDGSNFVFASEINPFWSFGVAKIPNESVWLKYFAEGSYGLPNETFWQNIKQLPGGHFLIWKNKKIRLEKWYHFEERILDLQNQFVAEEEEYIIDLLLKATKLRFRADVPIGFNLSGGLDSSTLLALIDQQKVKKNAIEAFTFITNDERYDEVKWVKGMLDHKPYHLNVCSITANEIPTLSLDMARHQSEPFGGIPTLAYAKIFEQASRLGVKVLLDGQGADESWAGYDYYINKSKSTIQGVTKSPYRLQVLDRDFSKEFQKCSYPTPFETDLLNLQFRDLFYTKIPRALRFNDRVSMKYGTELREPFLDFELVEYVFSRPASFKIKEETQKWLLRKIASNFLKQDLVLAPKRPLQTPQREWLSQELKGWVADEVSQLKQNSWFDKNKLQSELDAFLKGDNQSSFHIWQWISASQILQA
jgi:asparagine synthase (glutamine-hydrolysing)